MLREVPIDLRTVAHHKIGAKTVSKMIPNIADLSQCPEDYNILVTMFEGLLKHSETSYVLVDVFNKMKDEIISMEEVTNENEKILSRKEFVEEIITLKKDLDLSWIDTDVESMDWETIHSINDTTLVSKLNTIPFKKANIATYDKNKGTNYLTYIIKD